MGVSMKCAWKACLMDLPANVGAQGPLSGVPVLMGPNSSKPDPHQTLT